MSLEADVRAALSEVIDPGRGQDLISAGMVKGLHISGDTVRFVIEVDTARAGAMEPLRRAAEEAVLAVPGVAHVAAILTAHSQEGKASSAAPKGPRRPAPM